MTPRDDDDDPVLASMRTVWLSMRDEEPPASGLAELLTAARAKAEAMQPKLPWWRRAIALAQRPPVLALATSVLLIGGAVAIGVRGDGEPPIERAQRPADHPIEARNEVARPSDRADVAPTTGSATASPTVMEDTEPPAPPPPRPAPARPRLADRTSRPAPPKAEPKVPVASVAPSPPKAAVERPAPAAPGPASPAGDTPPAKEERGLVIAQDDLGGEAIVDQGQAPSSARAADEATTTRSSTSRGPTVEQLARQSTTAAARGDCAAVRAIVTRMQTIDRSYSKKHVADHAAVAKCVK